MTKKSYHYHASGSSLHGAIEQPNSQTIAGQAQVSLPASGGLICCVGDAFSHEKIVSCSASYSHVSGSVSPKSGGWTTLVTSVVENLNILEALTADRVISRIAVEHPAAGDTAKVTLAGSNFINLRIAGFPATPVINFNLLTPADEYPTEAWLKNSRFLKAVRDQHSKRKSKSAAFQEIETRYGWVQSDSEIEKKARLSCSIVDKIDGSFPGTTSGNMIDIPEIGKFFLGEFTVSHHSFELIMVRAELGCAVSGSVTAAASSAIGHPYP